MWLENPIVNNQQSLINNYQRNQKFQHDFPTLGRVCENNLEILHAN